MLLENCHLAGEWINELETFVEQLPTLGVHPDFRLWMTLSATPEIPVSLLESSLKLVDTLPSGYKSNLQRAVMELPPDLLTDPELGAKKVDATPTAGGFLPFSCPCYLPPPLPPLPPRLPSPDPSPLPLPSPLLLPGGLAPLIVPARHPPLP